MAERGTFIGEIQRAPLAVRIIVPIGVVIVGLLVIGSMTGGKTTPAAADLSPAQVSTYAYDFVSGAGGRNWCAQFRIQSSADQIANVMTQLKGVKHIPGVPDNTRGLTTSADEARGYFKIQCDLAY